MYRVVRVNSKSTLGARVGQGELDMDVYEGVEWILPLRNRLFARFNSLSGLGTVEAFEIFQIRPIVCAGYCLLSCSRQ